MKLITFKNSSNEENYRIGALVSGEEIIDLTSLVSSENLTANELLKCFDLESGFLSDAESAISENNLPKINRADIEVCAPIPRPSKIICIGLNYRDHAAESGMAIPTLPWRLRRLKTTLPGGPTPCTWLGELKMAMMWRTGSRLNASF